MNTLLRACCALLIAVLAGCSTIVVKTDYDRKADFSGVETWAWHPEMKDPETPIDELVRETIEMGLAARGLEATDGEPDLHMGFYLTVEKREGASYTEPSYAYSRGRPGDRYWGHGQGGHEWAYAEGTLVLVAADTGTGLEVWRGSASEMVDTRRTDAERKAIVDEAVTRMLAQFPPGR